MVATNEFVNEIVAGVRERLGAGYVVKAVKVDKGNCVKLNAIDICAKGDKVSQVVYVDNRRDAEENVNRIMYALDTTEIPSFDLDYFADYEKVKEKLFLRLSSHPAKGVVKKKAFCDLYMTAAIGVGNGGEIQIKNSHLKAWGIKSAELFKDARYYAEINRPAYTTKLLNVLSSKLGFDDINKDIISPNDPLNHLKIITNETKTYGASAILYADGLPREFYMIPSSVHEVIIIPANEMIGCNVRALSEMVHYVNLTEVEPEDVLANHAYHCIDGLWEIVD